MVWDFLLRALNSKIYYITLYIHIYLDECKTIEDVPCQFPFVYKGKTLNGCTMKDYDDYWCSTGMDIANNGKWWGNCTGHCPLDCEDSE